MPLREHGGRLEDLLDAEVALARSRHPPCRPPAHQLAPDIALKITTRIKPSTPASRRMEYSVSSHTTPTRTDEDQREALPI